MTNPRLLVVGSPEQKLTVLLEADDLLGALALNEETARAVPWAEETEQCFLDLIGELAPHEVEKAKGIWAQARAAMPKPQPTLTRRRATPATMVRQTATVAKPKPAVQFHPSDKLPERKLPTIEEKNKAIEDLANLYGADPIAYAEGRKEWAKNLSTTVAAIDKAVRIVLDRRADDGDQNQATKIVAIGLSDKAKLWHAPNGVSCAAVRVGKHWENYPIESTGFHDWLLFEYGEQNQVKHGDVFVPHSPNSSALRDAIAQLKGYARNRGEEAQPIMRVGGTAEEVWIDLGDADWRSVRVTAEGWWIETCPRPFMRQSTSLALPVPIECGSIKPLQRLVNVRPEEFVLVAGWLLQALNPIGPYPFINVWGRSEEGKSTSTRMLLRTVDPNTASLRRASRKIEDLLIAVRNGWAIGLDNLSWISQEMSDTLCMISTGISSGTRKHYTNDEEHVFTVMRPLIYNGIPGELAERPDLVSRTIKLRPAPLAPSAKLTDQELDQEFVRIGPGVFGALLDGLVAAIRDEGTIHVDNPARLKGFERFAEAGCRAMGFKEWEFVKAYKANREQSLVEALDSDAVGQAVLAFMKTPAGVKGFEGRMQDLKLKLDLYRNCPDRDWPKDATRLSTRLDRIAKALAAVGIDCTRGVDRRNEGGTQKDVVLAWQPEHKPKS